MSDLLARVLSIAPQLGPALAAVPKTFDPATLKAAASAQAGGLTDFGTDLDEPLALLCASSDTEAGLNPLGRMLMFNAMRSSLVNRLLLNDLRRREAPELRTPLLAPIIVTGLPRTGTTALHRLLAADPRHAGVPFWRLMLPLDRTPTDSPEARHAEVEATLTLRHSLTPGLDAIHRMRADVAEECMHLTASSLRSRLFWNLAPVYAFQDWLNTADKTEKYRDYVDWLRLMQSHAPGKRLVMKAPDHIDGLDALLTALPEAMVVMTHRDLDEQTSSYLSLGRATRTMAVAHLDEAREYAAVLRMSEASIAHAMMANRRHPGRIRHVLYRDFVQDPVSAVQAIYRGFGLELDAAAREALESHSLGNRRGAHGDHQYDRQSPRATQGDYPALLTRYDALIAQEDGNALREGRFDL